MKFLKYNTTNAQPYMKSVSVVRVKNCNGFTAINVGQDPATVNDQILYPGTATKLGDTYTVGGNAGEIYMGFIQINFLGTGTLPQVNIIQKFYIDEEENC